jgi:hypothetical protein
MGSTAWDTMDKRFNEADDKIVVNKPVDILVAAVQPVRECIIGSSSTSFHCLGVL